MLAGYFILLVFMYGYLKDSVIRLKLWEIKAFVEFCGFSYFLDPDPRAHLGLSHIPLSYTRTQPFYTRTPPLSKEVLN